MSNSSCIPCNRTCSCSRPDRSRDWAHIDDRPALGILVKHALYRDVAARCNVDISRVGGGAVRHCHHDQRTYERKFAASVFYQKFDSNE